MTKSILSLSTLTCAGLLITACASSSIDDKYASDDCKTLSALMIDRNMNTASNAENPADAINGRTAKDQITAPWGRGGTNADKLSKERAAIRKAHRRKGCTR